MREFSTAAREQFQPEDAEFFEVALDGREMKMYHPGSGQAAIMSTMIRGNTTPKDAANFISLFFAMFDDEDQTYLQDRLMDRKDPFDIDSEGGMFDIFEALLEDVSASRPPVEPTDFQPPRKSTGRGSTASTRAKGRTSSTSRSRASSQS